MITVLIAHYNNQKFLTQCLRSCLNQTIDPSQLRICLVDDCSEQQDYTKSIFEDILGQTTSLKETDEYIVYGVNQHLLVLCKQNFKQGKARNIGIELTLNDSQYYMVLDSDDEMLPSKAEVLSSYAKGFSPNVGVVYADYDCLDIDTLQVKREYKEPYDYKRLLSECIVHSNSLITKEALLSVRENGEFFDSKLPPCEDYDLWLRIAEKFMIVHIPLCLSLVRIHKQNSTNTIKTDIWQARLQRIGEKLRERYGQTNNQQFYNIDQTIQR